jgi:predicted  nucleic acid-binding Zn-ribbon protein
MKTTAEDPITTSHHEKQARLSDLRKSSQRVTNQITQVSAAITNLTERIRETRVQELVEGNSKNPESLEMLQMTLEDKRRELLKLQEEQGYFASAEEHLEGEVTRLHTEVKKQTAQRFLDRYQAAGESARDLVMQTIAANDRLAELDAELRQSGLAEYGGKTLVLIARSGLSWNALAPRPIVGNALHVSDWLQHMKNLLGVDKSSR